MPQPFHGRPAIKKVYLVCNFMCISIEPHQSWAVLWENITLFQLLGVVWFFSCLFRVWVLKHKVLENWPAAMFWLSLCIAQVKSTIRQSENANMVVRPGKPIFIILILLYYYITTDTKIYCSYTMNILKQIQ